MPCSKGRVNPTQQTRYRLFADSGGFCQKPDCLLPLFRDEASGSIHVAEAAHIISAADDGPRAEPSLGEDERAAYENLILLCPTCHRIVDKAEAAYPAPLIREWKAAHRDRTAEAFGVRRYSNRGEARDAIEQRLVENRVAWEEYGPDAGYESDPESPRAELWRRHALTTIVPNNRLVLRTLTANTHLLDDAERQTLAKLKLHVEEFEERHLNDHPAGSASRFPVEMEDMLKGSDL